VKRLVMFARRGRVSARVRLAADVRRCCDRGPGHTRLPACNRKGERSMSIITILIIVVVVLLVLGFLGRGRF
jgi:hypothetical protein